MYEHVSGSTEGEDTPHTHFVGATGSTRHSHPHTGEHVHEREAREEREGKPHVQTGYEEEVDA